MILQFIRWFWGYAEFTARGKFPERLLNLTLKNGIRLWGMHSDSDSLSAYVSARDYTLLRPLAKRCGVTLRCTKKGGLPFALLQYKPRSGLVVGAILYIVISLFLSSFVWNIKINNADNINEYELRNELKSLGLYEGAKISNINVNDIENKTVIDMGDIAWISINITGTLVNVEISPRIDKKENIKTEPSNIIAKCDGVIKQIEAGDGQAVVKQGEAVLKGQMLVNGILEYEIGGFSLKHSDAKIYAETKRTLSVTVPLKEETITKSDNCCVKQKMNALWLSFPISISGTPRGGYSTRITRENVYLFGSKIPIEITTEKCNLYNKNIKKHTESEARKIAENRIAVIEAFSLGDVKSYTKKYTQKIIDGKLILTGTYTCIEDIAEQQKIKIDGSITQGSDEPSKKEIKED